MIQPGLVAIALNNPLKCPCWETEAWPEGKGAQESPFVVVYGEGKLARV